MAGVRIGAEDGLYAALDLKVKLVLFTNPLVLPKIDLCYLPGQIDRVVGLRSGEGIEGVEGLH